MKQLVASLSNETTVAADSFTFCAWINIIYDIRWLEEKNKWNIAFCFVDQILNIFRDIIY